MVLYVDRGAGFGDAEVVEGGPAGRTWGNPAVALGEDHLLVLWSSGEQAADSSIARRWAARELSSQAWIYNQDPEPVRAKRFGAAPVSSGLFLITARSEYESSPLLTTIATDAESVSSAVLEDLQVFDVGAPACVEDGPVGRCVVGLGASLLRTRRSRETTPRKNRA